MSSLRNIVALVLLLSYSLGGALGLKCYHCVDVNGSNPDCKTNPKRALVQDCSAGNYLRDLDDPKLRGVFNNLGQIDSHYNDNHQWNCMTVINKFNNMEQLVRTCAPTDAVCKDEREQHIGQGSEMIRKCCNTDYCNSSFKTNAGLFTLSACLVFITLLWK